jgi:ArsR family transcriptional regulator, zinc-responsive transcriptional repressor
MVGADESTRVRLDDSQLAEASELLRALGTPHRLAIVLELAEQPRCVHELEDVVGISQSLASQHLRVLRTTGLVTAARRGKETVYSLADEHIAHIARDALTHGGEPGYRARQIPDPSEPIEEH